MSLNNLPQLPFRLTHFVRCFPQHRPYCPPFHRSHPVPILQPQLQHTARLRPAASLQLPPPSISRNSHQSTPVAFFPISSQLLPLQSLQPPSSPQFQTTTTQQLSSLFSPPHPFPISTANTVFHRTSTSPAATPPNIHLLFHHSVHHPTLPQQQHCHRLLCPFPPSLPHRTTSLLPTTPPTTRHHHLPLTHLISLLNLHRPPHQSAPTHLRFQPQRPPNLRTHLFFSSTPLFYHHFSSHYNHSQSSLSIFSLFPIYPPSSFSFLSTPTPQQTRATPPISHLPSPITPAANTHLRSPPSSNRRATSLHPVVHTHNNPHTAPSSYLLSSLSFQTQLSFL